MMASNALGCSFSIALIFVLALIVFIRIFFDFLFAGRIHTFMFVGLKFCYVTNYLFPKLVVPASINIAGSMMMIA